MPLFRKRIEKGDKREGRKAEQTPFVFHFCSLSTPWNSTGPALCSHLSPFLSPSRSPQGKYLVMDRDEEVFTDWLKGVTGLQSNHLKAACDCLSDYFERNLT
jgi:hypothetical protein